MVQDPTELANILCNRIAVATTTAASRTVVLSAMSESPVEPEVITSCELLNDLRCGNRYVGIIHELGVKGGQSSMSLHELRDLSHGTPILLLVRARPGVESVFDECALLRGVRVLVLFGERDQDLRLRDSFGG